MKDQQISLLALGDSYTIGESVLPEERFPVQAGVILKEKGIDIGPIKIIATTGWTTDELKEAILKEDIQTTFGMVTLLIGVNNQYRGRDAENYSMEFAGLLKMAIGFAGNDVNRVIVLSIPDWGVTPFAAGRERNVIAQEIDRYNEVNRNISSEAGVHYIDITDITRLPDQGDLLAGDGLHPSGKMYHLWAIRLADVIYNTLNR